MPDYRDFVVRDEEQAQRARQSTSDFTYIAMWDDRFEESREVFTAREEIRAEYRDWVRETLFQPLYKCPECRGLYTERPHPVLRLGEACRRVLAKISPEYQVPAPVYNTDIMWDDMFPTLKFCHRGEYRVKHTFK